MGGGRIAQCKLGANLDLQTASELLKQGRRRRCWCDAQFFVQQTAAIVTARLSGLQLTLAADSIYPVVSSM